MRYLVGLLLIVALAATVVFMVAGRGAAPSIQILQPTKVVGTDAVLDVRVEAPKSKLSRLDIAIEQEGKSTPLFSLAQTTSANVTQETPERVRITRPVGKRALPDLKAGKARIVVTAARTTLFGWRTKEATAAVEVMARFTPPRVAALSTHHYVNHGGAEMVVYTVSPPDVASGVQVGDVVYPGFPAAGAGIPTSDAGMRVAFFALLYDQDLATPIRLFARDEAGNEAHATFDYKVFPKKFHKGRIDLNDAFLGRVVPEILEHSPELKLAVAPGEGYLPAFLKVNSDLRRANADKIIGLSAQTDPKILWSGPFLPLGNAAVESAFADHRTYTYQGKEVDRQVHLGFDLAVTQKIPVLAGNDGKVVYADYLGIYGNCVVIDHGMGVQSLYGHLSTISVKVGDVVKKDQEIARSGMTGLAGGDHLHFSIQVQGRPVNPVEWWDPHWIQDRVLRKIQEAGGTVPKIETAQQAAKPARTAKPAKKASRAKPAKKRK
jgi:murein DD-endopeptidase MepM/ murein hydrolase activator NlpD